LVSLGGEPLKVIDVLMIKRKYCNILPPYIFEMKCPKCKGINIDWSEYENHIWCYDCKQDSDPGDTEYAGIFSGPVPVHVSYILGLHFDRINLETNKIELFNLNTCDYDPLPPINEIVKELLLGGKKDPYGIKTMQDGTAALKLNRAVIDQIIEQRLNYLVGNNV
jgi:hypothetical protein